MLSPDHREVTKSGLFTKAGDTSIYLKQCPRSGQKLSWLWPLLLGATTRRGKTSGISSLSFSRNGNAKEKRKKQVWITNMATKPTRVDTKIKIKSQQNASKPQRLYSGSARDRREILSSFDSSVTTVYSSAGDVRGTCLLGGIPRSYSTHTQDGSSKIQCARSGNLQSGQK